MPQPYPVIFQAYDLRIMGLLPSWDINNDLQDSPRNIQSTIATKPNQKFSFLWFWAPVLNVPFKTLLYLRLLAYWMYAKLKTLTDMTKRFSQERRN